MISASPLATLGVDQLAATSVPAPRTPYRSWGPVSFLDELESVRAEEAERAKAAAQAEVPAILKLVLILELLGLPVPQSMINTLRTAGLTGMADQLETRNRRIAKAQQEGDPRRREVAAA